MSYVRFATICDHCGARSREYLNFPCCIECMDDVCPDCSMPVDDIESPTTCKKCHTAEEGEQ